MSYPELPYDPHAPQAEDAPQAGARAASGQAQRPAPKLLTAAECLAALAKLPGLILMGMLTPAQANAMRAAYGEILKNLKAPTATTPAVSNDKLQEMLRRDPTLLSVFESLLTDEQIAMLARGGASDEAG